MVGKKGYLRTIEAIVAILLVFGFLLVVLPSGEEVAKDSHEEPVALQLSSEAILSEIQKNDVFRTCVLNDDVWSVVDVDEIIATGISFSNKDGLDGASSLDCVYSFLDQNLPSYSPWSFAFSLCSSDGGGCVYYPLVDSSGATVSNIVQTIPVDANVYPKAIFLSIDDVSAQPVSSDIVTPWANSALDVDDEEDLTSSEASSAFAQSLASGNPGSAYKTLTIYFWEAS